VSGIAWLKVAHPDERLPLVPPDTDLRVLVPDTSEFADLADKFSSQGATVRQVKYLLEDEVITASQERQEVVGHVCELGEQYRGTFTKTASAVVAAARDAFDLMWQDGSSVGIPLSSETEETGAATRATPADALVPAEIARFLPYPALNEAQAMVVPEILGHDQNLLVVAPTGAGKTVMGMVAALRAVIQHGRKAVWLVPQRSLTDELDRELETWRRQGLRVERLSGEHAIDLDSIRHANMWVATTEKFEVLCRTLALREALAEVGALIVDEIHMLGDATRGPVLEALLTRIRIGAAKTRIVGLSATVSNADEIADWLGAKLLRSAARSSRLIWQLPVIPAYGDFNAAETGRTRLASAITGLVTRDGGSVIVFCGSKRNVRRTALVVAASRGVDVSGVRQGDTRRLEQICRQARIGLHYQGWEHRREAERAFRERETDVLIATSTVAAGVNLPARAVVIQDTQIGLESLDVATVQQMFGRAGRVGVGENNGWAFMIVDERERAGWQARLVAGHKVRSRILGSLPDHVLGEAVQQRITTFREAEEWWVHTLAYHQGQRGVAALRKAVGFLNSAQMLTAEATEHHRLTPTELGGLTAHLMVPPVDSDHLRRSLQRASLPASADQAEAALIAILATTVPKLAQARIGEDGRPALARLLSAFGGEGGSSASRLDAGPQRGDLARAALLAAARAPEAFHPGVRQIEGVPYPAMYQVLEESPRYLHWLACQGLFGTIHPLWAIVAADLELRIFWRMLQPPRGSGRLLWACEQMATPVHAMKVVPQLWLAARARGHASPDWQGSARPTQCLLDQSGYLAFLSDRATEAQVGIDNDVATARAPGGSVLAVWAGAEYTITPVKRGSAVAKLPVADSAGPGGSPRGAAVITWRGDYLATGWLAEYSRVQDAGISRAS
jgi:helicase